MVKENLDHFTKIVGADPYATMLLQPIYLLHFLFNIFLVCLFFS